MKLLKAEARLRKPGSAGASPSRGDSRPPEVIGVCAFSSLLWTALGFALRVIARDSADQVDQLVDAAHDVLREIAGAGLELVLGLEGELGDLREAVAAAGAFELMHGAAKLAQILPINQFLELGDLPGKAGDEVADDGGHVRVVEELADHRPGR